MPTYLGLGLTLYEEHELDALPAERKRVAFLWSQHPVHHFPRPADFETVMQHALLRPVHATGSPSAPLASQTVDPNPLPTLATTVEHEALRSILYGDVSLTNDT